MLLGPVPDSIDEHQDALSVLAQAGIVAPLRLIRAESNDTQAPAACQ